MTDIPKPIILFPRSEEEKAQILNIREKLLEGWVRIRTANKRKDIHLSSIIGCRRKVAFEMLDDDVLKPDEKTLKYFRFQGQDRL